MPTTAAATTVAASATALGLGSEIAKLTSEFGVEAVFEADLDDVAVVSAVATLAVIVGLRRALLAGSACRAIVTAARRRVI